MLIASHANPVLPSSRACGHFMDPWLSGLPSVQPIMSSVIACFPNMQRSQGLRASLQISAFCITMAVAPSRARASKVFSVRFVGKLQFYFDFVNFDRGATQPACLLKLFVGMRSLCSSCRVPLPFSRCRNAGVRSWTWLHVLVFPNLIMQSQKNVLQNQALCAALLAGVAGMAIALRVVLPSASLACCIPLARLNIACCRVPCASGRNGCCTFPSPLVVFSQLYGDAVSLVSWFLFPRRR